MNTDFNTTVRHVAYEDSRYVYTDEAGKDHYTDPVTVWCGDWRHGGRVLCDTCEAAAKKRYPQGWAHYPGDTCQHGVYVGGCGPDFMCGLCEAGLTVWVPAVQFSLVLEGATLRLPEYTWDPDDAADVERAWAAISDLATQLDVPTGAWSAEMTRRGHWADPADGGI